MAPDWWFPLGAYDQVMNEWFLQGPAGLDNRANPALFVAGALNPESKAAAEHALGLFLRLSPNSFRQQTMIARSRSRACHA